MQAKHPVQTQDSQSSKRPLRLTGRGMSDEQSQPGQRKTCYRCGSVNHTANYYGCPAKDAQCNSCKKRGHLAKVCRGSKQVHKVTVPDVNVLSVENRARDADKIMCTVQVSAAGGEPMDIELPLETGSAVSILPESVYLQCFNNVSLTEPKLHLVSYLRNPIPVRGCLHADVTFENYCAPAEFYILWSGTAILGRETWLLHLTCNY